MYTYLLISSVWKQNTYITNLDNISVLLLKLEGGLAHEKKKSQFWKSFWTSLIKGQFKSVVVLPQAET